MMTILSRPTVEAGDGLAFLSELVQGTAPALWVYGPLPGEDLEDTVTRREIARGLAEMVAIRWSTARTDAAP
ncbi:hypothetical protein [Marinitenerispora sediminis]|uniref:Uncharacterized protein n=1 Tax=Marinitenerispora sediminis TaxID=1931232 RepID=A0A368T3U8_9ACTN|nr:hypothetical protein [Marinitenerispora sediminis]RCV49749.1 hypothetical protein DEF28_19985 [Marinitenerispora sediminis]RCV53563.1 hypothetical protein DEF23_17335 [Marinitenerispora sediminis]RCV57661.1 hypothetical protein DEF24_14895 [Marinitenerispora sediminis]